MAVAGPVSSAVPDAAVWLCGVGVLVQRLAGLLGRHGLQSLSLDLPGLVVEEDAGEDQGGAGGAEDGDLVAEHDDAEPDGQGVLDGAGDAAGRGEDSEMVVGSIP